MRAPDFWFTGGPLAWGLAPLGGLYALGARLRRRFTQPTTCPVPVICVGNLVAGGAGKTPFVQFLAERLQAQGVAAHILLRGYGGKLAGPARVDAGQHDYHAVGDEALLLARIAPTWISRNRPLGAAAAAAAGAQVIIMDDGFQNPTIHKDLSVVVVDGAVGFGNGFVMPAGPLREPIAEGLARAQAILRVGEDRVGLARWTGALPVLGADLRPRLEAQALSGRKAVAFAGIGRPDKFFDSLRAAGLHLLARQAFGDHYPYAEADLAPLAEQAKRADALLVTTEKDFVRLPAAIAKIATAFPVTLALDDTALLDSLLTSVLARIR